MIRRLQEERPGEKAKRERPGACAPAFLCDVPVRARLSIKRRFSFRRRGRLWLVGQLGEARGVVDGDVGEDLAVELDAGLLEPVDELRVAGAVELGGGGDADNPERAELALLLARPV